VISPVGDLLARARHAQRAGDLHRTYDEVLDEISARAASAGSMDKADIGALVLWKRITAQARWSRELMLTPDAFVRDVTRTAYQLANDAGVSIPEAGQAARDALRCLPGMGGTGALASALLLALAPSRMAVWDRRVGATLKALRLYPSGEPQFYGSYLSTTLALASEMASGEERYTPRDVDLALFHVAGSREMLVEARAMSSHR
jgi:hypothetical protein